MASPKSEPFTSAIEVGPCAERSRVVDNSRLPFAVRSAIPVISKSTPASAAVRNVDISKFLAKDELEETCLQSHFDLRRDDYVLMKMLEEGLHGDIIFTARGGGSVKAHRSVLGLLSQVFKVMFQHQENEEVTTFHVDMSKDMSLESLQLFLLVVYTTREFIRPEGSRSSEPLPTMFKAGIEKHFLELFRALTKYQVMKSRLKPIITSALSRTICVHNCSYYYDIASQYEGTEHHEFPHLCNMFIIYNFRSIVEAQSTQDEMRRNPARVQKYMILALNPKETEMGKKPRRI